MADWFNWILEVLPEALVLTLRLIGLLGLLVPIIPGLVIIWVAALGYGLSAGFGILGWIMFALITVLMIVGSVIDNVLMGTKAHESGAPWWVVLIALVAGIIGNFFLPVIGGILAALLALFLVEFIRRKDAKKALTSMKGMVVGCGWAIAIRFIMGVFMIGFWLIWALA
jgi:uncharacterized protein YqgC (DUF456 family)